MNRPAGFTLIEVLMALTVFTLLIAVVYGALGPAGDGFIRLQAQRDQLEQSQWLGRQLRMDVNYLSGSNDSKLRPIRITYDSRGDAVFDDLWLLSRESSQPSLTYIHYFLDEEKGKLIRESRMAWARDSVESMQWTMGDADSFDVQLLTQQGEWVEKWDDAKAFVWPKAIRIHTRKGEDERSWELPILVGQGAS